MCRLNPKVDFAFKKLFGSEENKDILMSFINSVLSKEEQIVDLELKNPYNLVSYRNGKMSILDIKAVDEKGIWYDVEMQLAEQSFYDKRALYYWAKVYSDQIESGQDYYMLKKTIGINILDFNYLEEEDYHNRYELCNTKTMKKFTDLLNIHFIELPKFKKDYKEIKTALDRWAAFLSKAYEFDKDTIPEELAKDQNIKKAAEKLDVMSLSKEEREWYENDLKAMLVRKAEHRTAKMRGREEGLEQGREEGREQGLQQGLQQGREEGEYLKAVNIAKNLLDVLDIETIAMKTGLSVEEIKRLKKE
ncbi:MAG: Rpn family recombination-promoting nuclease/putative transposase [Marinisporobacter sp.]|jgi:predicted transposase/invertase (TIGR01784 family)|nr:Rpn family recombination-promoting nuclease/putative transposase [Marinisporobacter sp.]